MVQENSSVLNYIDGVAVHYYGDHLAPLHYLADTAKKYPDKFILATEGCEGNFGRNVSPSPLLHATYPAVHIHNLMCAHVHGIHPKIIMGPRGKSSSTYRGSVNQRFRKIIKYRVFKYILCSDMS